MGTDKPAALGGAGLFSKVIDWWIPCVSAHFPCWAGMGATVIPSVASAHEVYVLPPSIVAQAIATPAFSEWNTILTNAGQFSFWGFITALIILIVFFVSISRRLEHILDPLLQKLPPYAPVISRITIGLSFLSAAYHNSLFGPELPLLATFGGASTFVKASLVVIGVLLTIGWCTRTAALAALSLFVIEICAHGVYMLTYTNYFGELLLLLVLGADLIAFRREDRSILHAPPWTLRMKTTLTPYAFPILRVAFGISLLYASIYAKVIHNNLALDVAYRYPSLVHFFGFEPHFLVVGAAIIEILIGLFFILGIEIRFTALFLLFWLSLSLWYFGEAVWPHVILIGIPIAFIFYGYDTYSLEGYFFKRSDSEPVL